MAKKKTIAELEAEARKAEARAKELRKKAQELTKAEEAKVNAEIIKAVREWVNSFPADKRGEWKDVPNIFRNWAEKNRAKYSE